MKVRLMLCKCAAYGMTAMLLLSVLAACEKMEETDRENSGGTVTAEISDRREAQTRIVMTDEDTGNRTTFEDGDEIRIGWDGVGTPYKYTYSASTKKFAAETTDKSNEMWQELVDTGKENVDVYAWYGRVANENSMPATGSLVEVEADQTTHTDYMSSLYLSAHQQINPAGKNMHFTFQHLISRLRLKITVADSRITQEDIMYAKAEMKGMLLQGEVIEDDVSHRWSLKTKAGATGEKLKMLGQWDGATANMAITFKAFLIPQTLAKENLITITLNSGRIFTCVVPQDIMMMGGQEVTLNIKLKSGDYEIKTTTSVLPDAYLSSYSGNRILSAVKQGGKRRICVYDKQLDGTWGTGSLVYESDTDSSPEFPEGQNAFFGNIDVCGIDLYGDYGVVGIAAYGNKPPSNKGTFFIKKSATTGRWFRAAGPLLAEGKGIGINKNFLVSGYTDIVEGGMRGKTYVYIINEEGKIEDESGQLFAMDAFKVQLAENNVLVTYTATFQLSVDNRQKITATPLFNATGRVATDGKKVILQTTPVSIYDLEKGHYDSFVTNVTGGGGRPVAIYDRYALAGNDAVSLKLIYFNDENKWQEIGDGSNQSFLHLLQANGQLSDVTALQGTNIFLKGPHAMVSSDGNTYFIENIDKMVEDYLANP